MMHTDRDVKMSPGNTVPPPDAPGLQTESADVSSTTRPAVLVNLDGDPVCSPIQSVDLTYAVNTNLDAGAGRR
jgi:hypothetical protein